MKNIQFTEDQSNEFGKQFLEMIAPSPFGSLPKVELEYLIFSALVMAGIISKHDSPFETATALSCTKSKIESLLYSHRNRTFDSSTVEDTFLNSVKVAEISENRIIFHVDEKFHREMFIERLKEANIYTDSSFNRGRVTVLGEVFMANAHKIFKNERSQEFHQWVSDAVTLAEPTERPKWSDLVACLRKQIAVEVVGRSVGNFFEAAERFLVN